MAAVWLVWKYLLSKKPQSLSFAPSCPRRSAETCYCRPRWPAAASWHHRNVPDWAPECPGHRRSPGGHRHIPGDPPCLSHWKPDDTNSFWNFTFSFFNCFTLKLMSTKHPWWKSMKWYQNSITVCRSSAQEPKFCMSRTLSLSIALCGLFARSRCHASVAPLESCCARPDKLLRHTSVCLWPVWVQLPVQDDFLPP